MRAFALLALLALAAVAVRASDVVEGHDSDLEDVVKSSELVLVEFYAPWCGHCKKLTPEWEKAATELKGKAVLVKVDATIEKTIAEKYEIRGYPTIKVFREGELSGDFEGGRTADAIVQWVKSNTGPAVKEVKSEDDLKATKADYKVLAVLYAAETTEAFTKVAKALRGKFGFAAVTDSALFDGNAEGSIVVYKQFDDPKETYDGDAADEDSIKSFLAETGVPVFDEIGPENYKQYIERKLPIGWLFVKPGDDKTDAAKEVLAGVAKSFKGKISVVWIDAGKYGGMAQRIGLTGEKFPAFAIDLEGSHYAFSEDAEIATDAIKTFFDEYFAGTLKKTVRSEKAPEPHTVDGLTTVVGSTFDELVANADQDVFIEFYAPWCGHCKSLAPTFEKLAKAFAKTNIRIAKMDATANDFDQKKFNVQGFPTMFFVKKGEEPKSYEGGRSFDDMSAYLKENGNGDVQPEAVDDDL